MNNLLRVLSQKGKTLLLGAALCGVSSAAFATHLMGGELTVTHLSGNSYVLILTYYRDASAGTVSLPTSTAYYQYPADLVGLPDTALRDTGELVRDYSLSMTLLPNSPYNVEVGVYTDTIQLVSNKYWFTTANRARNGAIMNMDFPDQQGIGLVTEFTAPATATNSSPRFLTSPVPYFYVNTAANYNPLPYDADGDSLVWTLNTPKTDDAVVSLNPAIFGSPVPGFTAPFSDPLNPFAMNAATGEITWTPNTIGHFVQSFLVDEYRGGLKIGSIIRDYQYIVIPGDTNAIPRITSVSGNIQYDASLKSYMMEYMPGQPLSFAVSGSVITTAPDLDMQAYSELLLRTAPAQFAVVTTSTQAIGTFSWMPGTSDNRNYTVVVRTRNGEVFRDYTLVLKRKTTPTAVASIKGATMDAKLFPNPTTGAFSVEANAVTSVRIFNNMGQIVDVVYQGAASGKTTFSYSKPLAKGLYFVHVADAAGNVKTLPLSVQ